MDKDGSFKVLMIDDDDVIAKTTAEYFNMFDVPTAYVTSYDDAVSFLAQNRVELLLLDINLGDKSGFDLCRKIRASYDMPIFFISARTSDDDVLIALNIGGDDYIKKPYTLNVLLAKVKAVLARYGKSRDPETDPSDRPFAGELSEDIRLDVNTHKVISGTEQISLKAMEYKLLYYLLHNRGKVVTKDELLKNVWDDEFVGEGTLAVHIRHLREKIEKDPKNPEFIKTVWGVGYIIEETPSK